MDVETATQICRLVAVGLLGVIIFIAFVKLLFIGALYKNSDVTKFVIVQQELVRLIGGLTVFVIAIVAHNPWVYFVSFLIGGLLIASEQFMLFLAGVLSSDKTKVASVLNSYLKMSEISRAEKDKKIESEAQEIVLMSEEEQPKPSKPEDKVKSEAEQAKIEPSSITSNKTTLVEMIKESITYFEDYVTKVIEKRISWKYKIRRNIKITDSRGQEHAHDLAIIDYENNLYATVEIKIIGLMNLNILKRTMNRSLLLDENDQVKRIFVFGFRGYDFEEASKLLKYREDMKALYPNLGVIYYEIYPEDGGYVTKVLNADDIFMAHDYAADKEIPF